MKKYGDDLTMTEALHDPLIAQVMRADGVQPEDFRRLLETAALRNFSAKQQSDSSLFGSIKSTPVAERCFMC